MTIVEFLNARLDEEVRAALESVEQSAVNLAGADTALVGIWHIVHRSATGTFVATRDQWDRVAEVVPTYGGAHAAHIALHDPARVLREVDAKRAILREYVSAVDLWERESEAPDGVGALQAVIRHMLTVYSDHPDYAAIE